MAFQQSAGTADKDAAQAADAYSQFHFGKQIVVTSLVRRTRKSSVHYWGRGADIRSRIYTRNQIRELVDFIVVRFPYQSGHYKSAIFHTAGSGYHIHTQVRRPA